MKVNGVDYIIEERNGNKFYYKVVNGQKIQLTVSELETLQKELSNIQKAEQIKLDIIEKINNKTLKSIQEINNYINSLGITEFKEQILEDVRYYFNKLGIEQLKTTILHEIKSKQITNYEQLKQFIDKYDLKEEREELLKYGKDELDRFNLNLTPVEEFAKYIKGEYQKALSIDSMFRVNLKAVDGVTENKYFEVSLATERDGKVSEYDKRYYVRFDDETTEKLINPIIREVSSKGMIRNDYVKQEEDIINNRYNYSLSSIKKVDVNITNIEEYYAKKLKEEAEKIEKEYGKNNNDEVSQKIEDENNLRLYNEELEREFSSEELQEMRDQNLTPDQYRELHKSGPVRVRVKPDNTNKGFASSLTIFLVSEFFAVLFILMQIIFL